MPFFFSTWLFQALFLPSMLSDAYRWGRAGPAIGSLRKLFEKDGLWTQPTLLGRGALPRILQPMQTLWCQKKKKFSTGPEVKRPTGNSPDYPPRAWLTVMNLS